MKLSIEHLRNMIAAAGLAAAAFTATPASAVTVTVMAPGSSWFYTFTDPTANPSWTTDFPTLGWSTGNAPFGNVATGDFGYASGGTFWPAGTVQGVYDLWVGRVVDFSAVIASTAQWFIGVDNGYRMFVNGTQLSVQDAGGYTHRWEYSGGFAGLLNPGLNYIALELDDYGGLTAFDMQITALIPLPGAVWLLLSGLGLLGWRLRRS
jgi:hypothetical protein